MFSTSPYGYHRWPPLILKDIQCMIIKLDVNQSANKCNVVVSYVCVYMYERHLGLKSGLGVREPFTTLNLA